MENNPTMKDTFFQDYQNLINSFEALKKEKENPFFKSKYVTLNQILPLVKKHCTDNNFVFMQYPTVNETKNFIRTEIVHISGKQIIGEIEIVSKDNNDPQKVGAGITYMRRYSLVTMFGLEDEDDDGNIASGQMNNIKKVFPQSEQVYQPTPQATQQADVCKKCGAKMVLNPKTQKYFCEKKCWLKEQPQQNDTEVNYYDVRA